MLSIHKCVAKSGVELNKPEVNYVIVESHISSILRSAIQSGVYFSLLMSRLVLLVLCTLSQSF